jgi:acyl-coenzyme A synthetase/AMP-(fatty) acid ligase/alkanesulfonate monooxygenase SsuD/methylene tetrahydromethanopterin reductase-like flavin-dependent oxidoreductase (luciferase family)
VSAAAPRIGVRLPQYGASWEELREAAVRCEALGFAGLWLNDHLQSPGRRKDEPAFDALTGLAALAPLTSRARLGVAVLSASYRPPALAAKMATVLDVISGGRVTLGLGSGSDRPEHRAYGIPFASPPERVEAARTTLRTMRAMFGAPEGASLDGVLENAPNLPPPVQPGGPPIWLAAHKPRLLRLAGEEADGIVAAFVGPGEVARRLARADEAREAAGRPALSCALYTYVLPIPSDDEAAGWLAREAESLGTTAGKLIRWLRTTGIVGSPDEVRDALAAHAEAGVTDAILVLPNRVPLEAFEALAEVVLARDGASAEAPSRAERADEAGGGDGAPGNLVHLLVERHRVERGGEVAAIDDEGEWTFDELGEAASRAAGALAAAGAVPGDRVAVLLPDGRPWLAAFLGAARLGAVAVPLDPHADPATLLDILEDCEPAVVVGEVPEGAAVPSIGAGDLAAGEPREIADVGPDELAYLVYSSGSTGRPKAAMHAHGDLRTGIEGYGAEVLGLGPGDRCHSVAKLFTSLGFGNAFFRVLGNGATAVLAAGKPTARSVLGVVAERGVTVLTAVPTFWSQLARFLERHPDPGALERVRLLVSSGDRLPGPVADRLREVAGVELLEGLGCSECSNVVISTRPGDPPGGGLGRATPGVEIRLADEDGEPVKPGTPGRLWIRSASNTSGYWRREELTAELLEGPWVRMGDMLVEEDGVYRHVGRADDLFKVDARWVSPGEVESALLEHPAVAEAAVVGRPDEAGLLRPAAFVVRADDAPEGEELTEALRRHVAHALEPYKAPRTVTALDELPRLPSGKLDRRKLREDPPGG